MDPYALTDTEIAALLGQRLRALRLRKNSTQNELAQRTTLMAPLKTSFLEIRP